MYAVSQSYLNKLFGGGTIQRRIAGLIDDDISFTENDILSGTFQVSCKAVASDDIKLGGVNVGGVSLTFTKAFSETISRTTWKNKKLSISIGLKIADAVGETPAQWEFVPLRPFYVSEAVHSLTGIDIKAYDNMQKFDKPFALSSSTGTLYDFLMLICNACGVTLGMTENECRALPNGTEILGLYANNDIETYRDMLYWLGVTACAFSDIDRQGRLVLRTWKNTADITINKYHRYNNGTWSDFSTFYTGLSVVNMDTEKTSYYGMPIDNGLTMNIGSNPLLQNGTEETKTRQRRAILTALQNFNYVPFKAAGKIDPCFDLGDVINYSGGVADDSLCCIMSFECLFKDVNVQGFGKDPALANTRSKEDKNIAGLLSKTSENEMVTYTFTNATPYEIDEGWENATTVISIHFATISPRVVKIFHEINLTVQPDGDHDVNVRVRYYLNNELISYTPYESWYDGGMQAPHILTLMYFLQNLELSQRYDWDVVIDVVGGYVVIPRDCCHAFLEGQGLVAVDSWDGEITCEDAVGLFMHRNMNVELYENVTEIDGIVDIETASDNMTVLMKRNMTIELYDADVSVLTEQLAYTRLTEDGNTRTTEIGDIRKTEGDA